MTEKQKKKRGVGGEKLKTQPLHQLVPPVQRSRENAGHPWISERERMVEKCG